MKKTLAAALAAVLLLGTLASCAYGAGDPDAINHYTPEVDYLVTDQGTFYFEEGEADTAVLVKYRGKATKDDHVVIPEKFGDRNVSGIGTEAFYNLAALVEVTIPATVTHIGKYAFASCTGLTEVTLPEGTLTVDAFAFANCTNLETIHLGKALTTISEKAFWNCSALADVALPDTLTTIGDGAFGKCMALPKLTLPASVTEIGVLAYYNCTGLSEIHLHDGIEKIGDFAFTTETTTLKNRIDVSGLNPEGYVAKYVANMADTETEEETDTETTAS